MIRARKRRAARRDAPKHVLSEAELRRQTADSLEYLYREGRATKDDVTRWVRLSSKLSGRIYEPVYRSSPNIRDARLWLRRREDLEGKLYAKRGGYFKRSRDVPSTIRLRGRDYRVEARPTERDGIRYHLTGSRGGRFYTMRNVHRPHQMFVVSNSIGNKTLEGVWLTDEGGTLRALRS